jgi:hypothetical protein
MATVEDTTAATEVGIITTSKNGVVNVIMGKPSTASESRMGTLIIAGVTSLATGYLVRKRTEEGQPALLGYIW